MASKESNPITRQEDKTFPEKMVTTGDILIQAKQLYTSWSIEKYNVTFKQALDITDKDLFKSSLIPDPEKLAEMKKEVRQISEESGIKVDSLYRLDYASVFEDDILIQFGDNPKLRLTELKKLYKDKNLSNNEKNKLARESTKPGGSAHFKRSAWHIAGERYYEHYKKPFTIPKTNHRSETIHPKIVPRITLDEIPKAEPLPNPSNPLFEQIPFSQKFEIIKNFEREYKSGGQTNRNIPFLEAIDLIQSRSQNPNSRNLEEISSLNTWFQIHLLSLPNSSEINASQISPETFSSFLNANSNIISLFDNQDSENKLGETTFKTITDELATLNYRGLQLPISKVLLTIPLENRPNINVIKSFINRCKLEIDPNLENTEKETKIKTILSEITQKQKSI